MPWCTFTSPEIAHVGMYEADARAAGHEVETLTMPLAENDRALLDGEEEGFLRVHLEAGHRPDPRRHAGGGARRRDDQRDRAGDQARGRASAASAAAIHPYPTQAEVFRKAADTWRRGKLTPLVRRAFAGFFRLMG